MITLIEKQTNRQVVLQKGDILSYRQSDGLVRFSRDGDKLAFRANAHDDGVTFIPDLAFPVVERLAEVIAQLAGLRVGKEIYKQKLSGYCVIEFK